MRRRSACLLGKIAIILILVAPAVLCAQPLNLGVVSYSLRSGAYSTITTYGNHAFVATGFGFKIYDITDASNPQEIVNMPTMGISHYVCTDGDYLFVADEGAGILVYDISNIMQPTLIDQLELTANVRTLYVRGSYLYVASEDNGLRIIDYSDPYNLELVNTLYIGGEIFRVSSYGNYLYIAQGVAGMGVYDVANPAAPNCIMIWNMPGGNTHDVFVFPTGQYVAVADFNNGVYLLSLAIPEVPTWVATDTIPPYMAATVSGCLDYGVSGWYQQGVQTFNFSGQQLDYLAIGQSCTGAFQVGDYIYATRGDSGLRVINSESPSNLYAVTDVLNLSNTAAVQVHDNVAYVANLEAGLTVMDVTDKTNPIQLVTIPTGGWAKDVLLSPDANYLYVADFDSGLNVFSLADPRNPIRIRTVPTVPNYCCHSLDIRDGVLYATIYNYGLNVFDLSDPANPQLTWHDTDNIVPDLREMDLSADGQYAYAVSTEVGIRVYSVISPDSLILQYTTRVVENPFDIVVKGNYAYVVDDEKGLFVLNVQNPGYIFKLDSLPAQSQAASVTFIDDTHLLMSDWVAGVAIVDVSNPNNITEINRCNTPGTAWKSFVSGQYAYLSDVFDLAIIDLYAPNGIPKQLPGVLLPDSPVVLNPACPNPFNSSTQLSFTLSRDLEAKLTIYDLNGRQVGVLADDHYKAGTYRVNFNPEGLASGMYFATLQSGAETRTQKLLLIK